MATVQVRYIVNDVKPAIDFYTTLFRSAMLSKGDLRLVLSAPNPMPGGGQAMPDGTVPRPGGWNRFAVQVDDLAATVATLRRAGVHLRSDIITGTGGKQVIVDDPSGNPVELFEPILESARLESAR